MFDPIECDHLRAHLAKVEGRIAVSEQTIARRQAEITKLELRGCDTAADRELLSQFERLLELQIADRERLATKLASYDML
jgi:hypothetical protein